MEDFKERFIALIIDKFGVDETVIIPDAKFVEDLGADSLDMVELGMEFEIRFKVPIPDDDMEKIRTVGDAENYLKEKLNL